MNTNTRFPTPATRTMLAIACVSLVVTLGEPLRAHAQGSVSGTLVRGSDRVSSAVVQLIPLEQSGADMPSDAALIDQSHLRFVPGVVPLRVGSTVEFLNSDRILHNVFSPGRGEEGFDLGTYPVGKSRFHTFNTVGVYVILCHVHPEMVAWVVVSPTSFAGVTRGDGSFVIDSVPAGSYKVLVWHRRWSYEVRRLDVPTSGIQQWTIRVGRRAGVGAGVR